MPAGTAKTSGGLGTSSPRATRNPPVRPPIRTPRAAATPSSIETAVAGETMSRPRATSGPGGEPQLGVRFDALAPEPRANADGHGRAPLSKANAARAGVGRQIGCDRDQRRQNAATHGEADQAGWRERDASRTQADVERRADLHVDQRRCRRLWLDRRRPGRGAGGAGGARRRGDGVGGIDRQRDEQRRDARPVGAVARLVPVDADAARRRHAVAGAQIGDVDRRPPHP